MILYLCLFVVWLSSLAAQHQILEFLERGLFAKSLSLISLYQNQSFITMHIVM
jgi:hypothetical protein